MRHAPPQNQCPLSWLWRCVRSPSESRSERSWLPRSSLRLTDLSISSRTPPRRLSRSTRHRRHPHHRVKYDLINPFLPTITKQCHPEHNSFDDSPWIKTLVSYVANVLTQDRVR